MTSVASKPVETEVARPNETAVEAIRRFVDAKQIVTGLSPLGARAICEMDARLSKIELAVAQMMAPPQKTVKVDPK